ncbi:hypothetical protein F4810DRAFT_183597 [Camillea tinctor]|nr:hypothetical protein F4810DRAFT_183597 [Camillea tinctor]
MPSRRGLPKLNIFSSKPASSSPVLSPPSPKHSAKPSISTPMSPPARLHLRNVLPSSPNALPTPPPPPRPPYSWLWQCHSCSTVYRLGCTRRCLVCSHIYCVSANPPSTTSRGKKRRRHTGMCASEFDYQGWTEWGAWRRKVLGMEAIGPAGAKQRERAFVKNTQNCWNDCDYPSECHHTRYRVARDGLQNGYETESPVEEPQSPSRIETCPRSPDDELPLNEALELTEDDDDTKSPTSPKSPLSQTSFFGDEADDEDKENTEQKKDGEKVWWVDTAGQENRRKMQSQRKVEQLTGVDSNDLNLILPTAPDSESRNIGKLTVRNLTDHDIWEDWSSDSSDSDPDDSLLYDSSGRNNSSSSESDNDDDDDDDEKENEDKETWEDVPLEPRPGARSRAEGRDKDEDDDSADLAALLRARDVYLRLGRRE